MTSHKRLVAVGLALCWVQAAFAEGSFFKDRREAAAQAKPAAAAALAKVEPAQTAPAQTPAPVPAPAAHDVEPTKGRPAAEQAPAPETPAPTRDESAQPPERHGPGSAQPAPAPTAPADISGQVSEVPTTDTLIVGGQRVTLAGVRGVSEMTQPLQRWIASTGNSVTCHPVGSHYRCNTANGSDIGQVVLQNGGGTATPDAPANYRGAEMQARMGHRGIWHQR